MRRALGLQRSSSEAPDSIPSTSAPSPAHPNRRRFVRDGEVPVTVIHRDRHQDDGHGGNELEAMRQSLREQEEARERAERTLTEAQNTIRDLQTKLAHERLGKDELIEAARRAETGKQTTMERLETAQAELAAEHASRQTAEEALAEALEGRRSAGAVQHPEEPSEAQVGKTGVKATGARRKGAPPARQMDAEPHAAALGSARKQEKAARVARRGRPVDNGAEDSEVVEWWKPGWKDRFR
jgi:hypothetical protein